jgi:hypothetical protein
MKESPWLYFGGLVFVCVGFLCYAQYKSDPEDTVWNDADIPPPNAQMTPVPGILSPDTPPMGCSDPFRHRKYAPSLFDAKFSIIGTF